MNKKMVLLHVYNTYNYGSATMGINFIHYFSSIMNDVIYFIELSGLSDLERIVNETLNINIINQINKHSTNKNNIYEKFLHIIRMILYSSNNIASCDPSGIIILGGDDLSEYYRVRGLIYYLYLLFNLSRKYNVFLVSQTIGPFYSWRKILARLCLKKCHIIARDPISYKYIKNILKLKNIYESSDLAFLDLPKQDYLNNKKEILKKYDITSNSYITLIPSGLVNNYTKSYDDYIKVWEVIITSLYEIPDLKSKKIILLAHVLKPMDYSDGKIIEHIKMDLNDKFSDHVVYISDPLLPSEARIILGNGFFTITGRMHGAISTFQMLKPAISLSYSIKYKGVLGENLGMNDLIIEADNDDLWASGEIVDLVMDKVHYILKNYDDIINRIKPAVDNNKKIAMSQIEYIAKMLGGSLI